MSELIWTKEGRKNLTETFKLTPGLNEKPLRYKDMQTFFGSMFSPFQGLAQYYGERYVRIHINYYHFIAFFKQGV
ncbi:unnamed protein product [Anisakis simplex]|uniref:Type II toxin-antitoxin system RelE/ParE family toxin n=1 Tax=Anisakis simplex TaxID=6269 RepID=A0A0M3J9R7_ANISI|nr:unnamed protein product [Anisakis simplex]